MRPPPQRLRSSRPASADSDSEQKARIAVTLGVCEDYSKLHACELCIGTFKCIHHGDRSKFPRYLLTFYAGD